MKEIPKRRSARLPEIRLYPEEKAAIETEFEQSFYSNKSEFIRYKLLDKTYSKYRQQRFEAIIKAGELLDDLGKIGNNVNQVAKVLNTYKDGKMRREELLVMVSAIKLIGKVKEILEETPEE
ncbi:MAG: plasmid mobilization relaxosome protein MobC [Saprospiraceae bacterium]